MIEASQQHHVNLDLELRTLPIKQMKSLGSPVLLNILLEETSMMIVPSFLRSRITGVLVAILLACTMMAHAEKSAYTKGSNPVVGLNLISFDPSNGELKARLSVKLPKSEIDPETYSPISTYHMVDELTVYASLLEMKSTVPYSSMDNYLDTTYQVDDAGNQFLYPFDHHQTRLKAFLRREVPGDSQKPKFERVPFTLDTSLASFTGYNIKLLPNKGNSPSQLDVEVDIQRTLPTKIFCIFLSVMMLIIALGYLRMAYMLHAAKASPDINELVFGGALLFSFPAIRNMQPLAPTMGVLTDYCGFFVAESLVTLTLIFELYFWMKWKRHTTIHD
jgi:Domain of unknown function (DUF4436)